MWKSPRNVRNKDDNDMASRPCVYVRVSLNLNVEQNFSNRLYIGNDQTISIRDVVDGHGIGTLNHIVCHTGHRSSIVVEMWMEQFDLTHL